MTIEDAEKGRMSYPTRYDPYDVNGVDLDEITISPRFAVAQGRVCLTFNHDKHFVSIVLLHRQKGRWLPQITSGG